MSIVGREQGLFKHLNVTMSEDQLTKLLDHLRIERFKENNSVNMEDVRKSGVGMFPDRGIGFVRKGINYNN